MALDAVVLMIWTFSPAWAAWPLDGTALCTATGYQDNATIVSDGAGGAIVTWNDGRSDSGDIYAQWITGLGNPGGNPLPVSMLVVVLLGVALGSFGLLRLRRGHPLSAC